MKVKVQCPKCAGTTQKVPMKKIDIRASTSVWYTEMCIDGQTDCQTGLSFQVHNHGCNRLKHCTACQRNNWECHDKCWEEACREELVINNPPPAEPQQAHHSIPTTDPSEPPVSRQPRVEPDSDAAPDAMGDNGTEPEEKQHEPTAPFMPVANDDLYEQWLIRGMEHNWEPVKGALPQRVCCIVPGCGNNNGTGFMSKESLRNHIKNPKSKCNHLDILQHKNHPFHQHMARWLWNGLGNYRICALPGCGNVGKTFRHGNHGLCSTCAKRCVYRGPVGSPTDPKEMRQIEIEMQLRKDADNSPMYVLKHIHDIRILDRAAVALERLRLDQAMASTQLEFMRALKWRHRFKACFAKPIDDDGKPMTGYGVTKFHSELLDNWNIGHREAV